MINLPFELLNLSKELKLASVPHSGWPPRLPAGAIASVSKHSHQDVSPSLPVILQQKQSNEKSFFEKIRLKTQRDRDVPSSNEEESETTPSKNILTEMFQELRGSAQPCGAWNSTDTTDNEIKRPNNSPFVQLERLSASNAMRELIEHNAQRHFDTFAFPILTPHGNMLFDFSKQSLNHDIHMQLMQLVRSSQLDKYIQKVFHKSGDYHQVDYKEARKEQLQNEYQNRDHWTYRSNTRNQTVHTASSRNSRSSPLSVASFKSRYDNDSNVPIVKDKTNRLLTMAKAIHFRTPSKCFELDGVDIAFNFQRDCDLLRQTCLRFHNDAHSNSEIPISPSESRTDTQTHTVFVVCTNKMRKIYRLLESILKPFVSRSISIVYVTFDEIKPFLAKYEHETDAAPSVQQRTDDHRTSPFVKASRSHEHVLGNNSQKKSHPRNIIITEIDPPREFHAKVSPSVSLKNLFKTDDNEQFLLERLRSASLILLLMKDFDEKYFLAFLRWYAKMVPEHLWLITSDYRRAQTMLSLPKSTLFAWPTQSTDTDLMAIVISSILVLPLALTIDYENYTMFVRGLTIVDEHCQTTSLDRNICVQMALLRIWLMICQRKTIALMTCDDELERFGELVQMMLTEYGNEYERESRASYVSIHGMARAKNLVRQVSKGQNKFSFDLITVNRLEAEEGERSVKVTSSISDVVNPHISQILALSAELYRIENLSGSTSQPHTLILLDRLTPLTIGVLVGVYQTAIFFENLIRESEIDSIDLSADQTRIIT